MPRDSAVADRFVQAPDHWSRGGKPIRAIVIHMAEGGGTVSWLTRNDGNSSHYVVEYTGRITQMVAESRAAGSMNPKLTRNTNDDPFRYLGEVIRYGVSALKDALGGYWQDPNAVVIAVEVEGFRSEGPNWKQRVALARLVREIRGRRGGLPCIGHRDQQSYKGCPGKKIPWVDYGGHANRTRITTIPTKEEPKPVAIKGSTVPEVPTEVTLETNAEGQSRWLYVYSDHREDAGNRRLSPNRPLLLTRFIDADTYAVAYEPDAADSNAVSTEMFVKSEDVASTRPIPLEVPTPTDPEPIRDAAFDDAIAALEALKAQQG